MSTLTQLQSSIAQTQSLLGQAQNIAFNVQRIEQAYSTSYGSAAGTGSTTAMVANAQTRWQNSVGAFEDSLKIQAGVVGNIPTNSSAMTSLVSASQNATGALAGGAGRQPAPGAAIPAALRPGGGAVRPRAAPMRSSKRAAPPPKRRASRTTRPSRRAPATSPATSPCSAATEAPRCWDGRRSSARPRSSP